MKTIAVSGGGADSGKTTVISALLRVLPGWGALKTSPWRGDRTVPPIPGDYELVTDTERLLSPGTDTRSYLDAGARRAAWLISAAPSGGRGVRRVRAYCAGGPGIVIEGGSLADAFSAGRRYVVVRAGAPSIKPEALPIIERADEILVNAPAGTPPAAVEALRSMLPAREVRVLDAASPADPGLAEFLEAVSAWARR